VVRLHLERHGRGARRLELSLERSQVERRWGGLGRPDEGRRVETFAGEALAKRAFERQLVRARRKGYWVGHHSPELIAAIRQDVDDEAGYLVYGDWLLEREDPRGELISADDGRLATLVARHPWAFSPPHWSPAIELRWWRGFARGLGVTLDRYAWNTLEITARVRPALGHPTNHFLRAFAVALPEMQPSAWRYAPERALHEGWDAVFHALPASVRRVGVSAGPLVDIARAAIGREQVEVIPGPVSGWLDGAARPPR